jgi:hypothetical protein
MDSFLILEGGNLTIALFFLLIAIFISTRSFIRPAVKKFIFFATIVAFSLLIAGHYYITTQRMSEVQSAFDAGEDIVCENRLHRKAAQGQVINSKQGWSLDGDNFTNPEYNRVFHTSRCIKK